MILRRDWTVTETAIYDSGQVKTRTVETGLTRRRARRSVPEWQRASDRNKALISVSVGSALRKPLPWVTYRAVKETR